MIIDHIFGAKYYANIVFRRGTDMRELSSFIFKTKYQAERHRFGLETNRSFGYVETVSFRSKKKY